MQIFVCFLFGLFLTDYFVIRKKLCVPYFVMFCAKLTEMNNELANVEEEESNDTESEGSTSGVDVDLNPESRAEATERRPRVQRRVCVLLILLVLFAALFLIIALAAVLFVYMVPRPYPNSLASPYGYSSATTPFLPSNTFSTTSLTYIELRVLTRV